AVDPSRYRLAIIGTPVWAFSMASPVRSFLVDYREKLPRVAFFCTLRSSGSASVFQEMEQAAGQKPLACLTVKDREVTSNSFTEATEKFAVALLTWLKG
ncbi:MAG TPA: flavodoxin, partial [bacterium]|nr:flavodoxin [bacterium]